jgi:acyl-CoA thioester hydrolase
MDPIFEHQVDVRWRDTDALGHVNHAVFLTYLEEGRDAFFVRTFGGEPDYVVAGSRSTCGRRSATRSGG